MYMHHTFFFEIPLCAKEVNFTTEFAFLAKIQLLYEVKKKSKRGFAHGGISKTFFLYHFSPSFSYFIIINFRYIFHFEYVNEV